MCLRDGSGHAVGGGLGQEQGAAAAKDGANAAEKAALTELSQHGRITSIGAVWEDLIVVTVTDQTFAAINPLTGGVQILRW